jgi:hypothetical protein
VQNLLLKNSNNESIIILVLSISIEKKTGINKISICDSIGNAEQDNRENNENKEKHDNNTETKVKNIILNSRPKLENSNDNISNENRVLLNLSTNAKNDLSCDNIDLYSRKKLLNQLNGHKGKFSVSEEENYITKNIDLNLRDNEINRVNLNLSSLNQRVDYKFLNNNESKLSNNNPYKSTAKRSVVTKKYSKIDITENNQLTYSRLSEDNCIDSLRNDQDKSNKDDSDATYSNDVTMINEANKKTINNTNYNNNSFNPTSNYYYNNISEIETLDKKTNYSNIGNNISAIQDDKSKKS